MIKEKGPWSPAERSKQTLSDFEAMLEKKTKCQNIGCAAAITREDRICPKCGTKNEYWMH